MGLFRLYRAHNVLEHFRLLAVLVQVAKSSFIPSKGDLRPTVIDKEYPIKSTESNRLCLGILLFAHGPTYRRHRWKG